MLFPLAGWVKTEAELESVYTECPSIRRSGRVTAGTAGSFVQLFCNGHLKSFFDFFFFFKCSQTCTIKLLCTVYSCSASLPGRNREVCLLPAPQTRIHPQFLQSNIVHPTMRASSFYSDTFKELKTGTHCLLLHYVPILQWFFAL